MPELVIGAMTTGDADFTMLSLAGEIDLHFAPELMEGVIAALKRDARNLVFDLTAATFIDSTTLGSLVSASKRVRHNDGWIGVVCPDPGMARIFTITGLDRMFPVAKSVADLLAAVGGARRWRPESTAVRPA